MRDQKGVDLDGRKDGKKLGRVEGGKKCNQDIEKKSIFYKRGK